MTVRIYRRVSTIEQVSLTLPSPTISTPHLSLIGGVRVSTDAQTDKYGPQRQRDDITREAERLGLTVCHWVEEAVSGTDHDRAAENAYYVLARQHPGLNFMFSHPNRVGRHVEVTVGIARQLHALGGTVYIAGLGSLRDRRNWRYFLRDAAEAENDHSDTVERLHKGKYDKAARNRWPHGAPPYGYRLTRDERGKSVTLEIIEAQAETVRRIFALSQAGNGAGSIAVDFTRAGVPARAGGGIWYGAGIRSILKNSAYAGRRIFEGPDGRRAVLTFPAIVSAELFASVEQLTTSRRTYRKARTTRPLLLAGHLRCAVCGLSMQGKTNTNTQRREYTYYRCACAGDSAKSREAKRRERCAHMTMHRAAKLDEAGWAAFLAAMQDPAFLAAAAAPVALASPDHAPRITEIRAQQAQIITRAVTHALPDEVVTAALAPLLAELGRLERDSEPLPIMAAPDMTELAQALAGYLPGLEDLEGRRAALATWNARLHVGPNGVERVEIDVQRVK